jgi:hypothetical protein
MVTYGEIGNGKIVKMGIWQNGNMAKWEYGKMVTYGEIGNGNMGIL